MVATFNKLFSTLHQENIMLVTKDNRIANVSPKLSSTTHPKIFANLHEKLEPTPKYVGKMFNIEQRAKITQLR